MTYLDKLAKAYAEPVCEYDKRFGLGTLYAKGKAIHFKAGNRAGVRDAMKLLRGVAAHGPYSRPRENGGGRDK